MATPETQTQRSSLVSGASGLRFVTGSALYAASASMASLVSKTGGGALPSGRAITAVPAGTITGPVESDDAVNER